MYIDDKILLGKGGKPVYILPKMANRHGLICGATGTGKTITLKVLAESFSTMGVPVFLSDIKGDLASLAVKGKDNDKVTERVNKMKLKDFNYQAFPVRFWDLFGKKGHPVRTTVSDMGALLLAKLMKLNDTQTGVLSIVFRIADDKGMLLLDLKDLRAMLNYIGENAGDFTLEYGNVSTRTIGAILRSLITLEDQGAKNFFGEPALDIFDWMQVSPKGLGIINILHSVELYNTPALYSTFLLWMLSELYETLPEAGDLDRPKMVFFFDEAHLLFNDAPKVLIEKIEQVVRLIRSKGVGVYFITQNPADLPDSVLGQLGNRIQHALRAYTPSDMKKVKAAAQSFRANPKLNTQKVITELETGEALISCLDAKGTPSIVERALICPPQSEFGSISPEERSKVISSSVIAGKYERVFDRESAYEILHRNVTRESQTQAIKTVEKQKKIKQPKTPRKRKTLIEKAAGSAVTAIGRELGRRVIRGVLGSLIKR